MIEASTLDAAVADVPAKPRIMPSGVRRWIPAAVEMTEDGSPISDAFIVDAAAKLNAEAVSIPIDGGTADSEAHETASKRAVGWAHRAAVVDGQLFLEAEVLPDVAEAIDAGTLAYSSIDVDFLRDEDGAYVPGSAHLITHALTNTPRNRGIAPMQAVTHERRRTVHSYTRARLASEESMAKKTTKTAEAEAPVETIQAAEPVAEEKPPEVQAAEDAPPAMSLEDALAKIAELEAKLAAMESAMEASAIEASAETAEQANETAAVAAVERAIGEGRITAHARDKWLASARADLATFTATVGKRPAMARAITARAESSGGIVTSTVQTYSDDETHLAAMLRSGGLTEDKIKATIAQRRGKVV